MSVIVSGKSYNNASSAANVVVRDYIYAGGMNDEESVYDFFKYAVSDEMLALEILNEWELPEELTIKVLAEAMAELRKEVMGR